MSDRFDILNKIRNEIILLCRSNTRTLDQSLSFEVAALEGEFEGYESLISLGETDQNILELALFRLEKVVMKTLASLSREFPAEVSKMILSYQELLKLETKRKEKYQNARDNYSKVIGLA
jgi:hypothetical protein